MEEIMKEKLAASFLRGDAHFVSAFLEKGDSRECRDVRDAVLREATHAVLEGKMPFCQLTSICQAACPLYDGTLLPVSCCGGLEGSTSPVAQNYMMMLLKGWGVPTVDLGLHNPPEAFLNAAVYQGVRIILCTAFTADEAEGLRRIHEEAVSMGVRKHLTLLLAGVHPREPLPADNTDFRLAAAAEEAVKAWKR